MRRTACLALALGLCGRLSPAGEVPAGRPAAASLQTFRIVPGFRVELVACEPDVQDPVALAWDEAGRLWVAEMADYPTAQGGGRLRVLEDRDGDGRVDAARVVHDGLPFVAGLLPFRGGLLAASAPHVLLLDAQGSRPVLTGFGEGNTQLRVNGLQWGMDGWIYAANGRSGGKVRRPDDPPDNAVDISSRDVRFDAETFRPEAAAGPSQFGHALDAWGRRFLSWNTIHIRQDMLSPRDLERHPRLRRTATVAHISDHEDSSRIFPIAPPPRTFNQEPVDRFNASCGLTIECGGIFPPGFAGNAFTCEPLLGLVHRDVLVPGEGPAMVARRGEEGVEFLAAADPWFHPVLCRSGPDGALYIADFYREMVEHPDYVRQELRQGVDFARGKGHGRIWRIVPEGAALLPVEDLGRLDAPALAARLESPNGRVRETAQRLLVERRALDAVERLRAIAGESPRAEARAWALWTLERLRARDPGRLLQTLGGGEPRLREVALRIVRAGPSDGAELSRRIVELTVDADPPVRLQACLAAGDAETDPRDPSIAAALGAAARASAGDPWLLAAVASSSSGRELEIIEAFVRPAWDDQPPDFAAPFAHELASLADGAAGGALRRGEPLATALLDGGRHELAFAVASGLAGARRPPTAPGGESWSRLVIAARATAGDAAAAPGARRWAIGLLAHEAAPESLAVLAALVDPRVELGLSRAAARALGEQSQDGAADALLEAWPRATPALRGELLEALLRRPGRAAAILPAIAAGRIGARDLDASQRDLVLRSLPAAERSRLTELLRRGGPAGESDRAAVVARAVADATAGDAARGRTVFAARCATCHRLDGRGHAVGPDLAGARQKSREELLTAILDPNQSTVPGYSAYAATLEDGRVATGILAAETARAITLRRAEGVEETIPRSVLRSLEATGASLMPEGLEAEITAAAMADLLAYLRSAPR